MVPLLSLSSVLKAPVKKNKKNISEAIHAETKNIMSLWLKN